MRTVLTNAQNSRPIEDVIRERLEKGDANTFLVIVSTERARLKRQRECLEYTPNRAVSGLYIHTFESLVKRLLRHIGMRHPISRGLQTLFLREIVDKGNYPSLKSGPEIPLPQRAVTELQNTICQLKTSGTAPSRMRPDSAEEASRNLTADTLADFITIYETYSDRLGDHWIDWADVHRAIACRLSTGKNRENRLMRGVFPDVDLVIVEGVDASLGTDFSILEGIAQEPGLRMYITLNGILKMTRDVNTRQQSALDS